jgi:hypothetical protein
MQELLQRERAIGAPAWWPCSFWSCRRSGVALSRLAAAAASASDPLCLPSVGARRSRFLRLQPTSNPTIYYSATRPSPSPPQPQPLFTASDAASGIRRAAPRLHRRSATALPPGATRRRGGPLPRLISSSPAEPKVTIPP